MPSEPRQYIVLDVVSREVANTLCQFERAHSRVGNNLQENRLGRVRRMRKERIALEPDRFVALVIHHSKRTAADGRGSVLFRRQRSTRRDDTKRRQLERG